MWERLVLFLSIRKNEYIMNQSVLKGDAIFNDLSQSLNAAKTRIVVVSAWFTDQQLLDILLIKQREGVFVSVVIGDNKDNDKLDFEELLASGGELTRIKGKGYGMMHQKYCVIDDRLGFHGSYNWSVNARTNNSESVIKTDHKSTIEDLLKDFKKLTMIKEDLDVEVKGKTRLLDKLLKRDKGKQAILAKETDEEAELSSSKVNDNPVVLVDNHISIDDVFRSIISAEAKKTDEESLKKKGYNLSKEVSGDHNVLTKSMDSLYHVYISDNAENVELKEKLTQKIDKKKDELIQLEEIDRSKKNDSDEIRDVTKQKELSFEKVALEKEQELTRKDIELTEKTIQAIKEKITDIKDQVLGLELDFMKPAFNWFAFIPLALFVLGLGIYLMLFYSSSLYIMIYSYQDAMALIKAGVPMADINPQVFESAALSKSFQKEGIAGIFIVLFFFVPLVIAYVSHLREDIEAKKSYKDYVKMVFCYLVVIFIDGFIAAKVTSTIINIKIEAKQLPPDFELTLSELFVDLNFWLVFCLGALPFIFLSVLIEKLSIFFKGRSPETEKKKLKHHKKTLVKKSIAYEHEVDELINVVKTKEKEVVRLKNDIIQVDKKISFLPIEMDHIKTATNNLIDKRIEFIVSKASLFLNDIDNDNISVSFSTLNHRISSFVSGWNEWLHDEYSIDKARLMSDSAHKIIDQWLEEKATVIK